MDRWLWVVLSHVWTEWRTALVIVKPETVIWHRRGFRLWWLGRVGQLLLALDDTLEQRR
jgi:hypothetical protein